MYIVCLPSLSVHFLNYTFVGRCSGLWGLSEVLCECILHITDISMAMSRKSVLQIQMIDKAFPG